jgi:hypothetical protein
VAGARLARARPCEQRAATSSAVRPTLLLESTLRVSPRTILMISSAGSVDVRQDERHKASASQRRVLLRPAARCAVNGREYQRDRLVRGPPSCGHIAEQCWLLRLTCSRALTAADFVAVCVTCARNLGASFVRRVERASKSVCERSEPIIGQKPAAPRAVREIGSQRQVFPHGVPAITTVAYHHKERMF